MNTFKENLSEWTINDLLPGDGAILGEYDKVKDFTGQIRIKRDMDLITYYIKDGLIKEVGYDSEWKE